MSKVKNISQTQLGVIKDLFAGQLEEEEVLKKWRVRRQTYNRWHTMSNFTSEYKRRLKQAKLEGERIMAKYSNVAASKLVALTQSEKEEIARKASLDVINYFSRKPKSRSSSKSEPEAEKLPDLPPEVASRLLAALAQSKKSTNAGT
jgi:hypothetical protein